MLLPGSTPTLTIARRTPQGLYLTGETSDDDVLLPNRYVTPAMHIGDQIEVFLYLDQDERLVATTERPVASVGQFAFLECAWTNQYGAFLRWGIQMKDLFCPFREQKQKMQQGRSYIVYIRLDEDSFRLMATAKVEKFLLPLHLPQQGEKPGDGTPALNEGECRTALPTHGTPVSILIWQKTPLGFKCIVDNRYQGQLYANQLFQPVAIGDQLTAYVDHIRQDGKIDLTLQPTGRRHTLDFAEQLLRYLHEHDGFCPLSDASPAEAIYAEFQVSKKAFKRAVGDLYRRHLITLSADGLHLS